MTSTNSGMNATPFDQATVVAGGRPEREHLHRLGRATPGAQKRVEHDLLGDLEVPGDVYWGVHTARAMENFAISGIPIGNYPELVQALACVKHAAVLANVDLGLLGAETGEATSMRARRSEMGTCTTSSSSTPFRGAPGPPPT